MIQFALYNVPPYTIIPILALLYFFSPGAINNVNAARFPAKLQPRQTREDKAADGRAGSAVNSYCAASAYLCSVSVLKKGW